MPSRETLWFVPLVAVGLLAGMVFTIFLSPAIGVPLLVIAAVVGAVGRFARRGSTTARMEDFHEQAEPGVEFSERDRATLTPTSGEPGGR